MTKNKLRQSECVEEEWAIKAKKPLGRRVWPVSGAVLLILVVCVAGFGCSKDMRNESAPYEYGMYDARDEGFAANNSNDYEVPETAESGRYSTAPLSPSVDQAGGSVEETLGKKIVYSAQATLKVDSVTEAVKAIEEKTISMGGYIVQSTYAENDLRANISIKVPQNRFSEFKDGIVAWGTVLELRQSSDDIGLQYFDMEARMKNLEAQEQRYLEILQDARTVDEILKVQKSLTDVRTSIESYKGQLRYWDNQVDYAQVSLMLRQGNQDLIVSDPWEPTSFSKTLTACKNAILKTISTLWNVLNYWLVGMAYLSPILVVGGVILAVVLLLRRRRRRGGKPEVSKAEGGKPENNKS
ncbi:MAG: DUF4349 domain-containing protein [Peptococcaceae bacterium]|nr:DUF4349 domain-containing protein [Peptococcaceae bacterium]